MSRWRRVASLGGLATRVTGSQLGQRVRGLMQKGDLRQRAMDRLQIDNARQVVETLGQMKGAAMKVGQQLAMAAQNMDLPDEVHTILGELHDQAKPIPFDVIERTLKAELGTPLADRLTDIDREPLGTASLAQAHLAARPDGAVVVVKVLHEGIEDTVKTDLMAVKAMLLGGRLIGRDADEVNQAFEELEERLNEELDYLQEAVNIATFERLFDSDPRVTIPAVHPALSTERVLTLDLVPGLPIDRFIETATPQARERAGLVLAELFFEMAFVHRTLHADPHPGNYLFQEDGTVSMLDFGCVKRFDEFWIGSYARAVLAALDGDRETTLRACRDLGAWTGENPEAGELIWTFCDLLVHPWRAGDYQLGGPEDNMFDRVSPVARKMWMFREIRGPRDILFLHRTLGGLYTLARQLGVTHNWGHMLRHYLAHAIDVADGKVSPDHHPGSSIQWPEMTEVRAGA